MDFFKVGNMNAIYWFVLITMLIIVYSTFFANNKRLKMFKMGKPNDTTTKTEESS